MRDGEMRGQTELAPLFSPDAGIPAFSSKHFAPAPAGCPAFKLQKPPQLRGAPPFFVLSCEPISYCRFKRIDVYIF
jgi:hypothetical protein